MLLYTYKDNPDIKPVCIAFPNKKIRIQVRNPSHVLPITIGDEGAWDGGILCITLLCGDFRNADPILPVL